MNRINVVRCAYRAFASAAPHTTTGIEHADALAKLGGRKPNWSLYKVTEYQNYKPFTFYDMEITLSKHRQPQPSNKKPDVLPKAKAQ